MAVIVDTNALSAWLDGDPAIEIILRQSSQLFLSPIVLGEYQFGILSSKYRDQYQAVLKELLIDFQVVSIDADTAVHYAQIRKELKEAGTPIPWHDIWIAAQARQHQFKVLTKDGHFGKVQNMQILNW
jgi:predicted nucleic acid-binding protein